MPKQIIAAGGLVTNPHGEILWIFRRGFWDLPKGKLDEGETIQTCVIREVQEETGLEVDNIIYLSSFKVNDWRYRNERNSIKTLFFVADYIFGTPIASDDIAEVHWVLFDDLRKVAIRPGHRPLTDCLIAYLLKNKMM